MDERDKRRAPRHNVKLRLICDDDSHYNHVATLNVSECGMLLTSDVPFEPGTRIGLIPIIDHKDDHSVVLMELRGRVVRAYEDIMVAAYAVDRFHMGVEFELTHEERAALEMFMNTALPS